MASSQRNKNGTFAKGYKGGPGRPSKEVEKDYLTQTMCACSPEKWGEIVRLAVADAEGDDSRARGEARAFLRSVIFGKAETGTLEQVKKFESQSEVDELLNLTVGDDKTIEWLTESAGWSAD